MTDVYWLASYPKSGNTWMRALIHSLMSRGPIDINLLRGTARHAGNAQSFQELSLIDPGLLSADEIDDLRPAYADAAIVRQPDPPFHKTHDRWRLNRRGEPVLGRRAAGAIYIVRDPRDVAVSFAHHSDESLERIIDTMTGPERAGRDDHRGNGLSLPNRHSGWSAHVLSWLDQDAIRVHLVRYEELRRDTVRIFAEAMAFAGRPTTPASVQAAVDWSDFQRLQQQEAERGFVERSSRQNPFFRSGKVGDWRRHLSDVQLARLEAGCAVGMARLGYAPVTRAAIADQPSAG